MFILTKFIAFKMFSSSMAYAVTFKCTISFSLTGCIRPHLLTLAYPINRILIDNNDCLSAATGFQDRLPADGSDLLLQGHNQSAKGWTRITR